MRLYLVRHGIAEDHHPLSDAQRALTPRGRLKMAEVAKGLSKIKVRPDLILTSPLRRAMETASILADGLGGIRIEQLRELGQGPYQPADIVEAIRPYNELKEVALVGHQPGLGELAAFMLTWSSSGCEIEFKKGSVVCLDRLPGNDRCVLAWSLPPRILRSL